MIMVQVDVFWSYALGAGFAATAARQLKNYKKPFETKFFTYTVLFLGCIFAPSGAYLLWEFPSWETMHVADAHSSIPGWLVVGFAATNVLLGILGYWISYRLVQKGKYYAAHIQWFIGYYCMFFILIYGWDGTGWQRFLYDKTLNSGELWSPGTHHMGFGFAVSNVALTLYAMGIVLIPLMMIPMVKWLQTGAAQDPGTTRFGQPQPSLSYAIALGVGILGIGLGSSAITAVLAEILTSFLGSHLAGIAGAVFIYSAIASLFLFRKNQPFYRVFERLNI